MAYKKSIDNFKSVLQGGSVRPTMFQVELTFPTGTVADTTAMTNEGIFLCKGSQLPASVVGNIDVPFRGRKLKVTGDRSFEDWTVTITNDVSFQLRAGMEKWSELCQNHNFALGANTLDEYFATAIVRQLDRQGNQLRAYTFEGIWPTNVAAIDLDMGNNDTVEEYEVTFAVQYWAAARNGDPSTSATAIDPLARINRVST